MAIQAASEIHVLFADPDVVLCLSARRALQRHGFTVVLTHDGADALDLFGQSPFSVAVVGAALPVRNGLQVLREIKKQNRAMPVILIGETVSELSALALREGASAYLPIPIDNFEELISAIDHALVTRESRGSDEPREVVATTVALPARDESALVAGLRELIESVRTRPLPDTMQVLLEASAVALNAEHAVILLSQPDSGLQLDSARGFSDAGAAARDFVRHVGDAFAWRVAAERRTLIDQIPAYQGSAGSRFIGTPLLMREQVLGVLVVYPLAAGIVSPTQIAWLETLAAQGALAVHLARLDSENERLSPHDPLTGVLKRTVFLDLADCEFRRSWRYNQPLSAIIADVDGIGEINANSGREFGDRVLRQVANACRNIVRSIDLVGRYENDSFVLLLLMTDRDGAKNVADRLQNGIGEIHLSDERDLVRITATLGVCSYPRENCASIFDLLAVVQESQRAAQRSGANQVVYA